MMSADDHDSEPGGDDMLAAEYVVGALQPEERREVTRRIEIDPDFARRVDRWEALLSPLAADYPAVEPVAAVKEALDRRLFSGPSRTTVAPSLWRSLAFWRVLAAGALAALALYIAAPFVRVPVNPPAVRLVASLADNGGAVRYLVVYDAAQNRVALSHVSGNRAPGRDFELWVIGGDGRPVSVGVIPRGETVHLSPPQAARGRLAGGAVFAISVEPEGGSPTGRPTGPVIASGTIRKI